MKQLPQTKNDVQLKIIAFFISFVIIFMASANGVFTYSGAYMYLDETIFAILFAIAVQFTIIVSLLALPFVRGFGKISLIAVYATALMLSTLSAFTFIYNESLPEETTNLTIDTTQKAQINNILSNIVRTENNLIKQKSLEVKELKRLVDEEGQNGGRSGKGPGKGPIYYQKLDQYENANTELTQLSNNYEETQNHLGQINAILARKPTDEDRQQLMVHFASLGSMVNSSESRNAIKDLNSEQLANLNNPVDKALKAMTDIENYSLQLIASLVWAAIFDLIALFLGIIRYYLLTPSYSFLDKIHNSLISFTVFFKKMRHLPQEAKLKYHRESGVPLNKHEIPLNSTEMQNFATKLLAGSQMATEDGDDPAEPLQILVKHIEPLNITDDPHAIGITTQTLDDNPQLKTLMAMLIQTKVFKQDTNHECYILNADDKYAQKVMVFLRMGMKESPSSHEVVQFLTQEQPENDNKHNYQLPSNDDHIEPVKEPSFDHEKDTAPAEPKAEKPTKHEWGNLRNL